VPADEEEKFRILKMQIAKATYVDPTKLMIFVLTRIRAFYGYS
jgi:hypothetical protein